MKVYFPYETARNEQTLLIKDIMETISVGKTLLVHAPTGLGKTVSSLAPAISYAKENKKKVLFLTPKNGQHEIALDTINLMNEKFNLGIKAIDLIGKKNMCLDPFVQHIGVGFYEACAKKRLEGKCKYYNNSKGKTAKQKQWAKRKKASVINEYNNSALKLKEMCFVSEVCPYEVTVEMCANADVIIADYSHVFDEMIRKNIFGSAKIKLSDTIIIVDEAHNLSDRIRDMYSISLNETILNNAEKEARSVSELFVSEVIKDIKKEIVSLGKNLSFNKNESKIHVGELNILRKLCNENFENINETGLKYLAKSKKDRCALMHIGLFLEILLANYPDTLYLVERKGVIGLNIMPMNISTFSGSVINEAHSSILMSGTLLPLDMYVDTLGIINSVSKEYASPFDKNNRLNLFVEKTTTKYLERSNEQFVEIADIIEKCSTKIPGNVIVFFPSFEMMQLIAPLIKSSRKIIKQEREMSHSDRTNLIHNFKSLGNGFGGILLAVSGGTIAEGIDFPGENLLGAIIVGIPFAKVSPITNELIAFYDRKFKKGWDYAYNAPAISKAVQAAGRVIRTDTDKGVCIFLDKRFSDLRFKKFFPKDFEAKKTLNPQNEIEAFFK